MGADAGTFAPFNWNLPDKESLLPYPAKYDPTSTGVVYNLDGVPVSADTATQLLNSGAAEQCPQNDCGPRLLTVTGYGPDGSVVGSSSQLVIRGQAGWDGSLDSSYRVVGRQPLSFSEIASNITGFLSSLAGISVGEFGEEFGAAFQKVSGQQQNTTAPLPSSYLPGFGNDDLNTIKNAITEAKKLINDSNCQKALAKENINVMGVIKRLNDMNPRPDTASSYVGYNMFRADTSTDPMVQKFLKTEMGKGAGAFIYGQNIMVRDKFFNASGAGKIGANASRALALIHEAIHLTGRTDASFGGSAKLNDVVIKACFNKNYGHKDLSIAVP